MEIGSSYCPPIFSTAWSLGMDINTNICISVSVFFFFSNEYLSECGWGRRVSVTLIFPRVLPLAIHRYITDEDGRFVGQ